MSTDTGKVIQEKAIVMLGATVGGVFGGAIGNTRAYQKLFGFVGGIAGGALGKGLGAAATNQSYFTAQFVADHLEAGYVGFLIA